MKRGPRFALIGAIWSALLIVLLPSAVSAATRDWTALGNGSAAFENSIRAIAVSGNDVYVGGNFLDAAGIAQADYLARWNGTSWSAVGANASGTDGALNGPVAALAFLGTDLYAGGEFTDAGGAPSADYVARWGNGAWSGVTANSSATDSEITGPVWELTPSGTQLYMGGNFANAAGNPKADYVVRWTGSAWESLGSNSTNDDGALGPSGVVSAITVSGSNVYVGGMFQNAAGITTADFLAVWNGTSWSALGSNGSDGALDSWVEDIVVDGGNVYVGGWFDGAGGNTKSDAIARWNGSSWSALGADAAGTDGAILGIVRSLAVINHELYVGGQFSDVAGMANADYVARWTGNAWSGVTDSAGNALNNTVFALEATPNSLLAGGDFFDAGGHDAADYLAAWGPLTSYRPDARIKKGSGTLFGNNIYNSTGLNQTVQGSRTPGNTITFNITYQNDGTASDAVKLKATGTAVTGYAIKYLAGTTDITPAVVAGTYQTPAVAVGATFRVQAKVTVKSAAAARSLVSRLVTITSVSDPSRLDAVKLIVKRS